MSNYLSPGNKLRVVSRLRRIEHECLEVIFAFRLPEALAFADLDFLDCGTLIDYPGTVSICVCHAMPMKEKQFR